MSSLSAFRHPGYRTWQTARVLSIVASQMLFVALGWHVYDVTRRPLDLGLLGLAQFVPVAVFSLFAGSLADRVPKRSVVLACQLGSAAATLGLAVVAYRLPGALLPVYVLAFVLGAMRAFSAPSGRALVPELVPSEDFASAVAWGVSLWQLATIAGPAAGGLLFSAFGSPGPVYVTCGALGLVASALITRLPRGEPGVSRGEPISREAVFAGLRYVLATPLLLGSITLDLFAVLLGGATALLPVFARDVLFAGPTALGLLRAAPAVGAAAMATLLAVRPIRSRAGVKLFAAVAAFGAATIVFALSRNLVLSLVALLVLGAVDMVSVVIRQVIEQTATPREMRGRVGAVVMVFVGASNELGELESGLLAAAIGTVPAVLAGGLGTLLVVAVCAIAFPALRRADTLDAGS